MKKFYIKLRTVSKKLTRIIVGSVLGFINNNDYLKASALTLYTLISIVPFLAIAFGIASGFGFAEYLETELTHLFEDQPEMISYAIQFARSLLQNAKGSIIVGIGLIALLWANLSMLGSIESALNDVWHVKKPRTWAKKFTDYLAAMIICPIFFVVSSSLSVFLITEITQTAHQSQLLELMSPYLLFLLKLTPILLSIFVFIVIYIFIPNTHVRPQPRIIAGFIAGVAFQLWQWIYIKFQVEISNYGAIYGTFAALPLFLIWLQVSWLIFLIGAELGAQIENEMSHGIGNHTDKRKISQRELGVLILHRCCKAFAAGETARTTLQLANEFGTPLFSTQQMINILEEGGMLAEVSLKGKYVVGYQPSRDAKLFTIKSVCDAIDSQTDWHVNVENSPLLEKINDCLKDFDEKAAASSSNLSFSELA